MALNFVDIDTAIYSNKFKIEDNAKIVVKTRRNGYLGIHSQHTFQIMRTDKDFTITQDGYNQHPVVVMTGKTLLGAYGTTNSPYEANKVGKIDLEGLTEGQISSKILLAFKQFALDEFSFANYDICVERILISGELAGGGNATPTDTHKVIINFLNVEDNTKLKDAYVTEHAEGEAYDVMGIDIDGAYLDFPQGKIDGYQLNLGKSPDRFNARGTMGKEDVEINLFYDKA